MFYFAAGRYPFISGKNFKVSVVLPVMITKNEVKYIQSLSHKKNRDAEGLFLAETPKLVNELLASDITIRKIYATRDWDSRSAGSTPLEEIDALTLQRISSLDTSNKVLAIAEQRKLTSFNWHNQITLVLDGIQDPGNLGTILRIADWFGVYQVIATYDTADCYNPKVVQSSMGSIARVHTRYEDVTPVLIAAPVPVYGALLHGHSVYKTGNIQEGIIIIGNEASGIRENILPYIRHAITIPRTGSAESLNAAVATGIILSHLIRPSI